MSFFVLYSLICVEIRPIEKIYYVNIALAALNSLQFLQTSIHFNMLSADYKFFINPMAFLTASG